MSDVTLTVDGREVTVPGGTLLIDAIHRAGVQIPFYCYHPKLAPAGACRVCLVSVEKMPKLQTACTTEVRDGMVVDTRSDQACAGRRDILEFLLINHPLDCPICDKGGECELQDFTLAYGPGRTRFDHADKIHRRKHVRVAPFLVLDQERCILCQRCTRYEAEVTGERNIVLRQRGDDMVVAPRAEGDYPGYLAGNNTEICPVGAWTSAPYRFRARPWDLRPVPSVCTHCSLHCNVRADLRRGEIQRLMSRENAEIDGGWLCDRGRYGFGYAAASERLRTPLIQGRAVGWDEALAETARRLRAAATVGALGGGRLTDEECLQLQSLWRDVLGSNNLDWRTGAQAVAAPEAAGLKPAKVTDLDEAAAVILVDVRPSETAPVLDLRIRRAPRVIDLGPEPNWSDPAPLTRGGRYEVRSDVPSDLDAERALVVWSGRAESAETVLRLDLPTLIVGEQPNARGAEAAGLLPDLLPGYRPVEGAPGRDPRECEALYVVGARLAERPANVGFLVVQDLFLTPTARMADVVLPAAGSFEKSGTYTNLAGLRQPVGRVVPPVDGALPDGEILMRLARALGTELAAPREPAPTGRARPVLRAPEPRARADRARLFDGDGTANFDPHLREARQR